MTASRPSQRAVRAIATAMMFATAMLLASCTYFAEPPEPSIAPPDITPLPTPVTLVAEDAAYPSADGQELGVHACFAPDEEPRPALVLIHGGGFVAGSPEAMYSLCDRAAEAGYAAFAIEYRLLPEYSYPAQVDDAASAVRWLRAPEQSAYYGIDPDRVGVLGSSAGAIVATYLGTSGSGDLTSDARVGAVVALSPVTDMTDTGLRAADVPVDAANIMLAYLGCTRPGNDACPVSVEASPVTHVDATDSPMLLVNGDAEIVPVPQPEALQRALEGVGVESRLIIEPGEFHGQQLLSPMVLEDVFAFLDAHLAE